VAARILLTMNVRGPIPFNAAAAYGVGLARPTRPATSLPGNTPTIRPEIVDLVDTVHTKSGPTPELRELVAGVVRSDINRGLGFDGDPASATPPRPEPPHAGGLHLYSRNADRLEVATRVELGRNLDLKA
jgi:hypothetical protein